MNNPIVKDWDIWERLLTNGYITRTARDVAIDDAVSAFLEGMVDDPAYQADATVEGELLPMLVTRESALECSLRAAPGSDINIGDLVAALGEEWLVTELYADEVGIINGTLWICNDVVKFQNHSSAVHIRPCVIDDGSYSKKNIDPKIYSIDNTYKLYLALDEATKYLFVDKRLAFGTIYDPNGDPILETYKIIGIDIKSKNLGEGSHLMLVTLQRDVYNSGTDSIEDGLCDVYIEPGDDPQPAVTGSCLITGKDNIRIGTTRKYSATFTDAEGQVVDDVTPVWTVTVPTGITYKIEDGIVTVEVPLSEDLIGSEVVVNLTSTGGVYGSYEKKVKVITIG